MLDAKLHKQVFVKQSFKGPVMCLISKVLLFFMLALSLKNRNYESYPLCFYWAVRKLTREDTKKDFCCILKSIAGTGVCALAPAISRAFLVPSSYKERTVLFSLKLLVMFLGTLLYHRLSLDVVSKPKTNTPHF